jgi:hypothetical protein
VTIPGRWVEVPGRIVGPSLTAAGLAAWVLAKNHHEEEAAATRELQDVLVAALGSGEVSAVRVSRETVERAATLWETAATLLETWSASGGEDPAAAQEAARLRTRVISLRKALEAT